MATLNRYKILERKIAQRSKSVAKLASKIDNRQHQAVRSSVFTPTTVNIEERSIVAAISTPTPVRIYDYFGDKMVDEVLVPRGCKPTKPTMRMLNSHNQHDVLAVIGTVDQIATTEREVLARLTFTSAPDVEPIFVRVAEGHVTDVSIRASYLEKDFIEISPGKSRSIGGITYTATDVTMRVVKRWVPIEASIVGFGADENATMRKKNLLQNATPENDRNNVQYSSRNKSHDTIGDENTMRLNSQAMRLLVRRGMSKSANVSAMQHFVNGLSANDQRLLLQRDQNASVFLGNKPTETTTATRQASASTDGSEGADASNLAALKTGSASSTPTEIVRSEAQIRADERNRIKTIRELATADTPADLVQKACDEGWTTEQAGLKFYDALRTRSQQHVPSHNAGRTGIHVKRGATIEALQGAMLLAYGHELDSELFQRETSQSMLLSEGENSPRWLVRAANKLAHDQPIEDRDAAAMEDAHKYKRRSKVDIMRFALKAAGRPVPSDNREVVRAAMSSSVLPRVFGPLIASQVLRGFEMLPDTTIGWVPRIDVADLRPTQMIQVDAANGLDEITPGVDAQDLELQEFGESVRVRPFGKRFIIDEDIALQDQIGALDQIPMLFGKMCGSMAPDLVYATLLANPNMADSSALFNTGSPRFNALAGTAFDATQLQAMESLMASQTIPESGGGTKALNLTASYLICGRNKRYAAKQITGSATVTSAAGNMNPVAGEYTVVADARINAGVRNPITKAFVAGSPKSTFLAAQGGEYGLVIGHLQGTGRAPEMRSMPLNIPGRWGYGWDVKYYIGLGYANYRGLVRNVDP